MDRSVFPGFERRQPVYSLLAAILLALGVILFIGGTALGSVFFRPSASDFFADPIRVMDEHSSAGFIGTVCLGAGAFMILLGVLALLLSQSDRIFRNVGVVLHNMGDVVEFFARRVSRGIRDPYRDATPIAPTRCKACHRIERQGAKFCSGCGAPM